MNIREALLHFWRRWRLKRISRRDIRRLHRSIKLFQTRIVDMGAELEAIQSQCLRFKESLDDANGVIQELYEEKDRAKETNARYNDEIERLESKLQIAEESTIPTMVAAHNLALETIKADALAQVKRQATGA